MQMRASSIKHILVYEHGKGISSHMEITPSPPKKQVIEANKTTFITNPNISSKKERGQKTDKIFFHLLVV